MVLHFARVGTGATVGAGAVVPNRMIVPALALAVGVPARIMPGSSRIQMIRVSAEEYVKNARRYLAALRRID